MRAILRASLCAGAIAVAMTVSAAADQQHQDARGKTSPPSAQAPSSSPGLATLKRVTATPMASRELEKVKGMHVHFLDAGNGKLHLAGDVKTRNNWSNIGGDATLEAPSYNGLCVAHGVGGIFIPTGGAPITSECP
jgi:hypothetical protein